MNGIGRDIKCSYVKKLPDSSCLKSFTVIKNEQLSLMIVHVNIIKSCDRSE